MPAGVSQRAAQLVATLERKRLITDRGVVLPSGASPVGEEQLTTEQHELFELLTSELDHCLFAFMQASTLSDRFDKDQAESIYRLGRYVVRLNEVFINCEIGVTPCVRKP
jgi:hypothetical protein